MLARENKLFKNQKSKYLESQIVMILLTLSGGLQDAYTYCVRGGVFANAQTGNVVLLTGKLFNGEWAGTVRYCVPLSVFALGIFIADYLRITFFNKWKINSWQLVAFIEAILLLGTSFVPDKPEYNLIVNAIVSFCCAMQIETFKKVRGKPYASTMCIGNIKVSMEALSKWMWSGNIKKRNEFFQYLGIVVVFATGAGLGVVLSNHIGIHTIVVSSCLLFIVFFILLF